MQLDLTEANQDVIRDQRCWLNNFDEQRLKRWNRLLKSNPEAAICEACTRAFLESQGIEVIPYEDLSTGGPDFRCETNGEHFYVECTCVTIEAATQKTGLKPWPDHLQAECYAPLTWVIRSELANKAKQLQNLDSARIVAIGTLHPQAGDICFDKESAHEVLTGSVIFSGIVNEEMGRVEDIHNATELRNSAFIRPGENTDIVESARRTISAALLCPWNKKKPNVVGLLHQSPVYKFNREHLPDVQFLRLRDGYEVGGGLGVEKV